MVKFQCPVPTCCYRGSPERLCSTRCPVPVFTEPVQGDGKVQDVQNLLVAIEAAQKARVVPDVQYLPVVESVQGYGTVLGLKFTVALRPQRL